MDLGTLLTTLGGLAALVVLVAGLYAVFKSSAADARIKRLQDERDDYLSRLNYIEPRFVELEQQNKLLKSLHNPTARLESLEVTALRIDTKSDKTLELLDAQERTLQSIHTRFPHNPTAGA